MDVESTAEADEDGSHSAAMSDEGKNKSLGRESGGELLIDFRRTSQISGEPLSEVWKIKFYLFVDHRGDAFSASFFNRLAGPSQMRPIA